MRGDLRMFKRKTGQHAVLLFVCPAPQYPEGCFLQIKLLSLLVLPCPLCLVISTYSTTFLFFSSTFPPPFLYLPLLSSTFISFHSISPLFCCCCCCCCCILCF
uniref:Uncharacterized protein n=1 Tax=Cacopsylla melanoneura TaxID=428564 RepID=A0A8D8ZE63_9HEMI